MRLFRVGEDGQFVEFREEAFAQQHLEQTLESWIEENPDALLQGDGLLIIGRQVITNLGSFIDLLALDGQGRTVVIELKRDRTPRETLAQALEYASYIADLDFADLEAIWHTYQEDEQASLLQAHAAVFDSEQEGVSFNKSQRMVLVGQDIRSEIRQTASYLNRHGLWVTCVEFGYFQTVAGERLLSTDVVLDGEPTVVRAVSAPQKVRVDRASFLRECDVNGQQVFTRLLAVAEAERWPIRWGAKGFSVNVEVDGRHVPVCFGFPPVSVYKQAVYSAFADIRRRRLPEQADWTEASRQQLLATGLFTPAKGEVKLIIDHPIDPLKVEELIAILRSLAGEIAARIRQNEMAVASTESPPLPAD
jgi:hypothetical protein